MPAKQEIESFLEFSVRIYRTDGVPDACLSLQNDYGADVNMLLYCCWVGANIGRFDTEWFDTATAFSSAWADNVVVPLRCARTWMKHTGCAAQQIPTDDCMTLRDKIKAVEFAAEKLQQEVLESLAGTNKSNNTAANEVLTQVILNFNQYAAFAEITVCDDVLQKFRIIIDAALPA